MTKLVIQRDLPGGMMDALVASQADVAAGRIVPGGDVLRELRRATDELEATLLPESASDAR